MAGIVGRYLGEALIKELSAMSLKKIMRMIAAAVSMIATTVKPFTCSFISGVMLARIAQKGSGAKKKSVFLNYAAQYALMWA